MKRLPRAISVRVPMSVYQQLEELAKTTAGIKSCMAFANR
jgi:predicted DNA-binding protein